MKPFLRSLLLVSLSLGLSVRLYADTKISQLPNASSVAATDIVPFVASPGSSPTTKEVTWQAVLNSGLEFNGLTITTSTGTLTIGNGKTLTFSSTLTFSGTDGSTLNVGSGGTLGSNAFSSTAFVPQTTTVNSHALSGNIAVTAADVSLGNVSNTSFSGTLTIGNGSITIGSAGQISAFTSPTNLVTLDGTQTLTNKTISGASNTLTVRLGSDVTGTTPVANGGTGQTSASAALTALLPSQSGASGQVLQSNGTSASWQTPTGTTIDVYQTAWLSPAGDDTTAAVGDPGHPYATAQAAYDAGALCLVLEPNSGGTYGTISAGSAVTLSLVGYGADLATVTISAIGQAVTLTGNGSQMVSASVVTDGLDGTDGDDFSGEGASGSPSDGGDAGSGNSAGDIVASGLHLISVSANGGDAGTAGGGQPADASNSGSTGGAGGAGASGGPAGSLTATDCLIDVGNLNGGNSSAGGAGGNAEDPSSTDNQANGGQGGSTGGTSAGAGVSTLTRCVVSSFSAAPGTAGTGGAGGTGINGGSDGFAGTSGESTSAFGQVYAYLCIISPLLSTTNPVLYRLVIESGSTVDSLN